MAKDQTIQALDRGLAILRLLARERRMTASAISEQLGVHQSTASRLLNSLHKAGLVKKPDFHSFALDYGALIFAGEAMHCFPAIQVSVGVCNRITTETGINAAVAVLHDDRLLYLTQCDGSADSSVRLINDSGFPVHRSSLGLVLAWQRGRKEGVRILATSIETTGDNESAEALYKEVDASMEQYGFLYLPDQPRNVFNAAIPFDLEGEPAAFCMFSRDKDIEISELKTQLTRGVNSLRDGIDH